METMTSAAKKILVCVIMRELIIIVAVVFLFLRFRRTNRGIMDCELKFLGANRGAGQKE